MYFFEKNNNEKLIKKLELISSCYNYTKNYALRNFFNYFFKILINGDKMGLNYIDFKKHFFKNLIYPNAWLSIFYFLFRKIASMFKFNK